MSAKNIGQSQLMFVTTANADLLYMKLHAREKKHNFLGLLFLPLNSRGSGENNSPSSWERCSSPLAETIAAILAELQYSDN